MQSIPIIGFSAFSGTGKTTLIEHLIVCFKKKGVRLAVIKHDTHDFIIDYPGKDSWRFTQAGADIVLISSPVKTAIMEQCSHTLEENIACMQGVDLILVEGYKQEDLPRVGICRKGTGKGLPCCLEDYIAIVTDDEILTAKCSCPCFGLDEVPALAEFLLRYTGLQN